MSIKVGDIVNNMIHTEAVVIIKIENFGEMISVEFIGKNTNKVNSRVISKDEFDNLNTISEEGSFNFTGDPVKFTLFAEAERIHSAYQFDPLFAVNCSIVDPLPHQVDAVYKYLLPQPRIRFLLADDTGAGKTIMTGLLIKDLLLKGFLERILIITPGGLTKQWQEDEMLVKFNLDFKLVNRSIFSSEPNVFQSSPRIITSLDFISREEILNVAGNHDWDLIVFDEAHKLSAYDYGNKQYKAKRYKAAELLSDHCEHLLLLTATPHRGRKDTFRKLLELLDKDIFVTEEIVKARINDKEENGINKFFIRRLKEDMKDWDGNPLFKNRFTQTVAYQLTPEEKDLYDDVTSYLSKKKEEALEDKNIHVSLALTVMQRRLASSIFAIKNTLERRKNALEGLVNEVKQNPTIWNQRFKIDQLDVENIDDYDELDDEEKASLDNILSDPKKFKLFTTAKSIEEIKAEAIEVKKLYEKADGLYKKNQEEQKFKELYKLLISERIIEGEKLIIFTEHKDTLTYLEERLSKNSGYKVVTIHGGKNVDERRQAQYDFAQKDTQILIATDAAGEGINLQFCRLLLNWDIPWNPNRLEQRMGRIHRYGQKNDVLVFNMVANNTKEGHVLERLLIKLDIIRESIGDDRVYDVIQDVFEDVSINDIIESVLDGKENKFNSLISEDNEELKLKFQEKIKEQKEKLIHSKVDYKDARELKENSDEKRLQPVYIKLFFDKAFKKIGGDFKEIRNNIFKIEVLPEKITSELKKKYNIYSDNVKQILFCFDKQIFLDYQNNPDLGKVHYINPGNPVFDTLIKVIRNEFREEMLKGTILISPDEKESYFAFFVKSQIIGEKFDSTEENVADERLYLVNSSKDNEYSVTSPAKLIDLHPPSEFTKPIEIPEILSIDDVINWSFKNLTLPQFDSAKQRIEDDISSRKKYLENAFEQIINGITFEINELQGKSLIDPRVNEKIVKKIERKNILVEKRKTRLSDLDLMQNVKLKKPEILGCAFVVPLTQLEYKNHYGMSRDDEAELIAMETAMNYEKGDGWIPEDVSKNNEGYDIKSINKDLLKRYIEVKGRSATGGIMLSENEMNRLNQLGETAWLYLVMNCKSKPELFRIQNPVKNLKFEEKTKGIQFFLSLDEWKNKIN